MVADTDEKILSTKNPSVRRDLRLTLPILLISIASDLRQIISKLGKLLRISSLFVDPTGVDPVEQIYQISACTGTGPAIAIITGHVCTKCRK